MLNSNRLLYLLYLFQLSPLYPFLFRENFFDPTQLYLNGKCANQFIDSSPTMNCFCCIPRPAVISIIAINSSSVNLKRLADKKAFYMFEPELIFSQRIKSQSSSVAERSLLKIEKLCLKFVGKWRFKELNKIKMFFNRGIEKQYFNDFQQFFSNSRW